MTTEATPATPSAATDGRPVGRTAAWLAKQVELGLGAVDLSLPQYRMLGLLDEHSAVSSDLAERLAVRPPTVTAVVDGLVARGLVGRHPVAGDRRRVDHRLTPEGLAVLGAADAFAGLAQWRRAFVAYSRARWGR